MRINNTLIVDTFAEAFSMRYSRIVVTALSRRWLQAGVQEFCGYGTSVIGCDAEVGVEEWLESDRTLDGRDGASLLAFGFSTAALGKSIANRTGQCLMTCPTTAVFSGLETSDSSGASDAAPAAAEQIELGSHLRYFGDGFQKSKLFGDRRFWRIPVMDGEFIVEESVGVATGVAGGNFLIQATDQLTGLAAAERAIDEIQQLPGVITPFPGGVARSGSKVGSRYPSLKASTAHDYCPTLRGRVDTELQDGVHCVYEVVIDGINFAAVSKAMQAGVQAATGAGIIAIGAGNYGGKLGKHHFHLRQLWDELPIQTRSASE